MSLNKVILDMMPATGEIVTVLTDGLKKVTNMVDTGFKIAKGEITVAEAVFHEVSGKTTPAEYQEKARQEITQKITEVTQQRKDNFLKLGKEYTAEDEAKSKQYAINKVKSQYRFRNSNMMDAIDIVKDSFARGGIANFPNTGALAMLHGTEAVVPLPDGRSIPISINTDEMAKALSPTGVAGANSSTLPGGITADALTPAMATAVNEVKSEANTLASADNELMQKQNIKLDELIRLMGKQVYVSEQTRSQLM